MNTSAALSLVANNIATVHGVFVPKETLTDNEAETLNKAFTALHGVLKTMGQNEIADDYLTNTDTLSELLGRAHRVMKKEKERRAAKEREAFCGKIDELIQVAVGKRAKAIAAYNALDADLKSEMPAPDTRVAIWVSDILPAFGKGWDLTKATKALHDMGYMVHVAKIDGRKKEQDTTPPYITATVGQSFRRTA